MTDCDINMVVRLDIFCRNLFPRLIRISNIKRRHIPFLSRKGQRVLQPAFSSVDGKIITIIVVNITITITAIFIIIIIIPAITIINITKTMIFNIIRKSDRAAQLPQLLGGRPNQVFAMQCIRIFSNPKWINSILHFLKSTHLYVDFFFFISSLEVTVGVDTSAYSLVVWCIKEH